MGRANTSGEQSFELKCDNEKFTVPSTVNFKAGESVVAVPVTFNIGLGDTETAKFIIPSKEASAYGNDTISVTVSRDYTWEKLVRQTLLMVFYGSSCNGRCKESKGRYKFI